MRGATAAIVKGLQIDGDDFAPNEMFWGSVHLAVFPAPALHERAGA
jgi:hypothetical protein